jgi:hypothetical protein
MHTSYIHLLTNLNMLRSLAGTLTHFNLPSSFILERSQHSHSQTRMRCTRIRTLAARLRAEQLESHALQLRTVQAGCEAAVENVRQQYEHWLREQGQDSERAQATFGVYRCRKRAQLRVRAVVWCM